MSKLRWLLLPALLFLALGWLVAQPSFRIPPSAPAPQSIRMSLRRHVMSMDVFTPRGWENPENADLTGGYVADQWDIARLEPQQQVFRNKQGEHKNVFVELGPDSDDILVIGAHYDSFGRSPGADDNASAVAALIELGIALRGVDLRRRVILVAYAAGEAPAGELTGSAAHAAALNSLGKKGVMVNLDAIGFYDSSFGSQSYPNAALYAFYPWQANFLALAGGWGEREKVALFKNAFAAESALPIRSLNVPGGFYGEGAMRDYWKMGFAAFTVTDTGRFRNPHWRSRSDKPETLDFARLALAYQGLLPALKSLAND